MPVSEELNSEYEWITFDGLFPFLLFAVTLSLYMLWTRKPNGLILSLIACAAWVVAANIGYLYVFELNPSGNRWVPMAVHLLKDLSGFVPVVLWSFVAAQKIDIAAPRHKWVPRALELAWLTFPLFFAAAVATAAAATVAQPEPTNLEMSARSGATVYRFLIVAPIIAYSLLIAYWFVRLFGAGARGRGAVIRTRILLVAGTFVATAAWGFSYLAWPFSEPSNLTSLLQHLALGTSLSLGAVFMFPVIWESRNHRSIRRFANDEPTVTNTAYAEEGTYDQDHNEQWMGMTIVYGEIAYLLRERLKGWQESAGRLAIFISQAPGASFSEDSPLPLAAPGDDPEAAVESYEIPGDHPLRDDVEADLRVHQYARYGANILREPRPGPWLREEPEWVQVLAVVAVDGGVMPEVWNRILLADEQLVDPGILEKYEGVAYRRENHRRLPGDGPCGTANTPTANTPTANTPTATMEGGRRSRTRLRRPRNPRSRLGMPRKPPGPRAIREPAKREPAKAQSSAGTIAGAMERGAMGRSEPPWPGEPFRRRGSARGGRSPSRWRLPLRQPSWPPCWSWRCSGPRRKSLRVRRVLLSEGRFSEGRFCPRADAAPPPPAGERRAFSYPPSSCACTRSSSGSARSRATVTPRACARRAAVFM